MQLQDAFSIPKIHWFRYSQKKLDSFYPNRFIFFHKTYSMPSNAEDLYQYVERTFDHAVDLVYEGLLRILGTYFFKLGWNVLVVNPSDVKRGDKERYQKQQM
jgi:hypothetical protein